MLLRRGQQAGLAEEVALEELLQLGTAAFSRLARSACAARPAASTARKRTSGMGPTRSRASRSGGRAAKLGSLLGRLSHRHLDVGLHPVLV